MEAVTVAVALGASVPAVAERLTQVCPLDADQLIEVPPMFWRVYVWLEGMNGPPWVPEELRPVAGLTVRTPGEKKLAAMVFAPSIVTGDGFGDPERLPDQPVKAYPEEPVAERETLCPLLYQLVPAGLTVPPLVGFGAVVRLYWVVRLAVYVALEEGAIIEWVWAPPSLHDEKAYRVPAGPESGEDTAKV